MLDFNIYVVGDPSSFYAALNAVAMILNQQGFLNSTFLVGGLVALISGILYMIGKQSDGPVPGAMGPVSDMKRLPASFADKSKSIAPRAAPNST